MRRVHARNRVISACVPLPQVGMLVGLCQNPSQDTELLPVEPQVLPAGALGGSHRACVACFPPTPHRDGKGCLAKMAYLVCCFFPTSKLNDTVLPLDHFSSLHSLVYIL